MASPFQGSFFTVSGWGSFGHEFLEGEKLRINVNFSLRKSSNPKIRTYGRRKNALKVENGNAKAKMRRRKRKWKRKTESEKRKFRKEEGLWGMFEYPPPDYSSPKGKRR